MFNSWTNIFHFERVKENRAFCDSLEIDINKLDKFPKACDNYLKDNFEFRTPLISTYHQFKLNVLHVSPHPENVTIGNDGWFFIAQKEAEIYAGELNFTAKELSRYEKEWLRRKKYLDEKGIKYFWVICPFAQYVYDDKLPFQIRAMRAPRRVDVLKSKMNTRFPNLIIDPVSELLLARKEGKKVFYQNDNHWNLEAGEVVSKLIIRTIKKSFPSEDIPCASNYWWKKEIKKGGLYERFTGIANLSETVKSPVFRSEKAIKTKNFGFPIIPEFPYPDQYELRFVNKAPKNKLRVLIIRDSFGDQLLPFLKESFGETVFIFDSWKYQLNEEIIAQFKPDLVLFIGLETHIPNMIEQVK